MKKILENFKLIWQDKVAGPGILFCLLLLIFSLGFFVFFADRLPPEVPLFYSQPWGQEQLALSWQLVILPFSALLFFIFNMLLASKLYSQHLLLAQILVWSSTVFFLLTTITLIKIIVLIT